jgi:hypothetical protein
MRKPSLTSRIKNYLDKQDDWVCGGYLQGLAMEAGYEAQNCGRRLREMENDGLVQVEYRKAKNGQKVAWYKSLTPKTKISYYVPGLNKEIIAYE